MDGPLTSGVMDAERSSLVSCRPPSCHGWNSCRFLAFSVTFLVLQLFDSLAHGGSQKGKKSCSFPVCFLKPFFLLEAELLSEADQAGAGGGFGSKGGTSLLRQGFDPSPIHDSSLSVGWLGAHLSTEHASNLA